MVIARIYAAGMKQIKAGARVTIGLTITAKIDRNSGRAGVTLLRVSGTYGA
jgi:hypothetical protein